MPDREKVIKGLEVCIDREPGKYDCYKCPYETDGNDCEINLSKDALALLKEQETGGWISVKDRMPEVGGWYLCFKEAAFVPGLRMDVHRWSATKEEWLGSEVGSRIVGVTHWMPLPEPPEEG